ncbi:hypothetical protein Slin15195_G115470 [Septoria linicola]|uniref:Secreted protein n=1 Tax=Septoria linicola TaxID=215465 RepID=A0A9Q9B690_9PEZI|nr:hypothetical protein Slin15195_G115470 [Septoria linicola]
MHLTILLLPILGLCCSLVSAGIKHSSYYSPEPQRANVSTSALFICAEQIKAKLDKKPKTEWPDGFTCGERMWQIGSTEIGKWKNDKIWKECWQDLKKAITEGKDWFECEVSGGVGPGRKSVAYSPPTFQLCSKKELHGPCCHFGCDASDGCYFGCKEGP